MKTDQIDVRDLIARYDHAEHVAKADAYFEGAAENPYYARKPFWNADEASSLLRNFSEVITHLELFPGATVLDFGAGTCWSSRMLAYMDYDVTACDVSLKALRAGIDMIERDPLRPQFKIGFLHYDGVRIDLADSSMDRIVCLDCFHHVADQRATLAEFFRLLRPGGIVAFSEPGPAHSRFPQSQFEMKTYGVIEGDIDIHWLAGVAREIGFGELAASYSAPPRLYDAMTLDRLISGNVDKRTAKRAIDQVAPQHENARVFFIRKPGQRLRDSRTLEGLSHEMTVSVVTNRSDLECKVIVKNTGSSTWLPQGLPVGSVSVGVSFFGANGELVALDYARGSLGDCAVEPGEWREANFVLPHPGQSGRLVFDLVSDGVTWFAVRGNVPVNIDVN